MIVRFWLWEKALERRTVEKNKTKRPFLVPVGTRKYDKRWKVHPEYSSLKRKIHGWRTKVPVNCVAHLNENLYIKFQILKFSMNVLRSAKKLCSISIFYFFYLFYCISVRILLNSTCLPINSVRYINRSYLCTFVLGFATKLFTLTSQKGKKWKYFIRNT